MRNHKQQCCISQCDVRYLTRNNHLSSALDNGLPLKTHSEAVQTCFWLLVSFTWKQGRHSEDGTHSLASLPFTCKWGIVSCCYGFWSALCERVLWSQMEERTVFFFFFNLVCFNPYLTKRGKHSNWNQLLAASVVRQQSVTDTFRCPFRCAAFKCPLEVWERAEPLFHYS